MFWSHVDNVKQAVSDAADAVKDVPGVEENVKKVSNHIGRNLGFLGLGSADISMRVLAKDRFTKKAAAAKAAEQAKRNTYMKRGVLAGGLGLGAAGLGGASIYNDMNKGFTYMEDPRYTAMPTDPYQSQPYPLQY